jgi:hypothetical protein
MDITIEQTRALIPLGCSLIAYNVDGEKVGHAHLSVNNNIATLADIVTNSFSVPYFSMLPFLRQKICYRNKGVGSKLLEKVIDLCKSSGISDLKGDMHGEIDRLESWYSLYGFTITRNQITLRFDR